MVRILIADDHALIRRVVRQVIEQESDLEVIAEACNGHEAEVLATQTQPDVVLMDLDMPECDGFEATERVLTCSPNSRVVIFTASQQEQHALRAVQCGAIGYITKDIQPEALINAIRSAARDELCMPRTLAKQVLAHMRALGERSMLMPAQQTIVGECSPRGATAYTIPQRPTEDALHKQGKKRPLSDREREILELMRQGRKNREIAQELSIAESTVHKHIQNIFEKLHARNRTEAIYLTAQTAL